MPVAFISDLHLTSERPESSKWFDRLIKNAEGKIDCLYILGDLFEVWIGDDATDLMGHGSVEQSLAKAAKSGIAVYFIHGNRDFLVGNEFEARTGCRILPDPTVIKLDSLRVLLTHGDTLCIDDLEHQEARKQMVTDKWKIAFLNKPVDERMETATRLRNKSEEGKLTKDMNIMDVNQGHVIEVMRKHDVQIMIHGHTHKPAVHDFMIDSLPARRYVLGDWYEQDSILVYDNGNFTLKR